MPVKPDDQFFKQIASQYAQADGEQLKQELESLQQKQAVKPSAAFRKRVWGRVNRLYYRRYAIAVGVAASILLIPLIFDAYHQNGSRLESAGSDYAASGVAEPNHADGSASDRGYEIIPLAMEIPAGYHIAGVEQDKEKTIYYIQNINRDNVVVAVTHAGLTASRSAGLEEFVMNGITVYGLATKDYQLLQFEKDGILYELTCRYDYNTLVTLGKRILV